MTGPLQDPTRAPYGTHSVAHPDGERWVWICELNCQLPYADHDEALAIGAIEAGSFPGTFQFEPFDENEQRPHARDSLERARDDARKYGKALIAAGASPDHPHIDRVSFTPPDSAALTPVETAVRSEQEWLVANGGARRALSRLPLDPAIAGILSEQTGIVVAALLDVDTVEDADQVAIYRDELVRLAAVASAVAVAAHRLVNSFGGDPDEFLSTLDAGDNS